MSAEACAIPKRVTINVRLRSPQIDYLRRVAEREDVTVSHALGCIIETHGLLPEIASRRPVRKAKTHVALNSDQLAMLDQLAMRWGLLRSDVVRRLVDAAKGKDPWMPG